jgi:DNA-binding response OmpR family regulator
MIQILSIDDSKAVHAFLNGVFEKSPVQLSHAYDGQEGLSLLEESRGAGLDLILLDWEMPKLSGIETLAKIRQAGIQTPIIMLTSKNSPEEIGRALELGATEYVMKPFTRDILVAKVESVLGRELG